MKYRVVDVFAVGEAVQEFDDLDSALEWAAQCGEPFVLSWDEYNGEWRSLVICDCCGADITHEECDCAHQLCPICSDLEEV